MKYTTTFKLILFSLVCTFLAASCVKEGPMGPAGADGKDGVDGTNGTDGTAVCSACHNNNQLIFAIENQYVESGHATLPDFERSTGECAICHTSQGFIGNLNGTYNYSAPGAEIKNPSPQNCYTCHNIHKTFTSADLALTVSGTITLRNTTKTKNFGKADVCATCHQGRTVANFPTNVATPITVGSRYGVHHGPQANVLAGVGFGLFEVGSGLVNSAHAGMQDACVTCHMGDAFGTQAGGHTLWLTYEYHEAETLNDKGCKSTACHPSGENMLNLVEDTQTEIKVLLAELKTKLDAAGITSSGSDSNKSGSFPGKVAGSYLTYMALVEDKSFGVHNPKYVKQLLENLIANLN